MAYRLLSFPKMTTSSRASSGARSTGHHPVGAPSAQPGGDCFSVSSTPTCIGTVYTL
jgi:hypothetical protein